MRDTFERLEWKPIRPGEDKDRDPHLLRAVDLMKTLDAARDIVGFTNIAGSEEIRVAVRLLSQESTGPFADGDRLVIRQSLYNTRELSLPLPITQFVPPGAGPGTARITTDGAHSLQPQNGVRILDTDTAAGTYNGDYVVTAIEAANPSRWFEITVTPNDLPTTLGRFERVPRIEAFAVTSTTARVTTTAEHGFEVDDDVTISGMTPTGYDGNYIVTDVAANPANRWFEITVTPATPATAFGTAALRYDHPPEVVLGGFPASTISSYANKDGKTLVTTAAAHGFLSGETVTITAANAYYNGKYTIVEIPPSTTNQFVIDKPTQGNPASGSVNSLSAFKIRARWLGADRGVVFRIGDYSGLGRWSYLTPADLYSRITPDSNNEQTKLFGAYKRDQTADDLLAVMLIKFQKEPLQANLEVLAVDPDILERGKQVGGELVVHKKRLTHFAQFVLRGLKQITDRLARRMAREGHDDIESIPLILLRPDEERIKPPTMKALLRHFATRVAFGEAHPDHDPWEGAGFVEFDREPVGLGKDELWILRFKSKRSVPD